MLEIIITWEAWAAALLLVRRRRHRLERARRLSAVETETRAAVDLLREPRVAGAKPAQKDATPAWPFAAQPPERDGADWLGAGRGERPKRRRPKG
ncbi:MAG TPA: hypothetical protein VFQ38_18875 [Longimicrobiales bacterium]|nr:hypothetical protein [Longimicrobiales bacterium]